MQILSSVKFEDIRIGDRVKSMATGNEGFIAEKIPVEFAPRNDDNALLIKWGAGNLSMQLHCLLDRVWMM